MLADELLEQLKQSEQNLQVIKEFWQQSNNQTKLTELETKTNQENFWQDKNQTAILKELQRLKNITHTYNKIITGYDDLLELIKLFSNDEEELKKISHDVRQLIKEISSFKLALLLDKPEDDSNCFITINSGAGGTESQDWADMLARMFLRFGEREKFGVKVLDYQPGETAGIKSATLFIKGSHAFGLLKSEHGIHRLVRISPYDAAKRRHTSFAGVFVMPEVETSAEISIDPKDLRIDTYRAGGAGGQHVNKTDSAVRITHLPTNIVVQCQSERSQTQNKETAMKMLMAKLKQKQLEEEKAKVTSIEKKSIEWGSQIRSYVLHPYKMVKDHRTEHESPQPDLVLDGELMSFLEAYLIWSHYQT